MYNSPLTGALIFYIMIIDSKSGNIETIGDVTEFKTTIDPKNLEFITTLLSSNLYSFPEQSFIREIVSNAWDSHVEAGTTNTPVIIKFNYSDYKITIRDYGTGLSEDKFNEMYCSIGSSTKRHTNTLHGGFGIGKFSSLACSNVVYITSYYNGVASMYVMTKNGNSIVTNLVNKQSTQEKNGVEITIKVRDFYDYKKALDYIHFFPNVYVDGVPSFNSTKIKRFKNFAVCTTGVKHKILLGNVLYPLNTDALSKNIKSFVSDIYHRGIVISFNIGELQVTPNRESIIYNTETIKVIEGRIEAAMREIYDMIRSKCKSDFTDPFEWYTYINDSMIYDFINGNISSKYQDHQAVLTFYPGSLLSTPITLCGRKIDNVHLIGSIGRMTFPNLVGVYRSDKIYRGSSKLPYDVEKFTKCQNEYPVKIVANNFRFTSAHKAFIHKNFPDTIFINDFTLNDYRQYVEKSFPKGMCNVYSADEYDFIINTCYKALKQKTQPIDFDSDATFIAFKNNLKAKNKEAKKLVSGKVILTVVKPYGAGCCKYKQEFKDYDSAIKYIKDLNKGILLTEVSNTKYDNIAWCFDYYIIKAAKNVKALLSEDKSLKCIFNEEAFNNNSKLKILRAAQKALKGKDRLYLDRNFINLLPLSLKDKILYYKKWLTASSYELWVKVAEDVLINKEFDEEAYSVLSTAQSMYDKYLECGNIISDFKHSDLYNNILKFVVLKDKLFRINYDTYKEIKRNKLFTILCKK